MSYTDYTKNAIMNKIFRNKDFSVPGVYISLHDFYGREIPVPRVKARFSESTKSATEVMEDVTFENMPAKTIASVGFWDSQIGGNLLLSRELPVHRKVDAGDYFGLKAGEINIFY